MASKQCIDGLNNEQKDAVTHQGGPMLVLAGAGSGKTRVLTHRYAWLSSKKNSPEVLAVTFTNKAANEMKERIAGLVKTNGSASKSPWIGTFHSQCMRVLRKEIAALGYGNDFTLYNESDQWSLVRHILKEFKLYEALYKGVLAKINNLKSALVTPEAFLSNCDDFGFEERLARIYVRYQDELKRSNALDYDDLIMLTIRLFEEHPKVLKKYREFFGHVLVDEFQDTNQAQYRLLRLLAGKNGSISVVGDDDQSIYRFRGAEVNNILSFEKDFPETKVVKLERNYRSTQNILNVSGGLINANLVRHKKTLWTDRGDGERVYHSWLGNEEDEARHIARVIRELYLKGACDYRDIGILYRVNFQSRVLEETLSSERIPYKVLGGISFYQRAEIKDLVSYIKLIVNNDDNISLRRIINRPARGIGASTISKIEQHAKKQNSSLYAAVNDMVALDSVAASVKEKLQAFKSVIDELSTGVADNSFRDAEEFIGSIISRVDYMGCVAEDKVENVETFTASGSGRNVREFIDSLSLVTALDTTDDKNAVSLLTLHGAKGLEFPVVFLTGIEEGILPYFKAREDDEIAEERRLMYVGMTRARDTLWLTGCKKRRLYTKVQEQEPSRFLKDIPWDCCQKIEKSLCTTPAERKKIMVRKVKKSLSPYVVGSRVRHPRWGVGVVRDFHGEGEEQKVTVNFPQVGLKRLALKFAHLERM